MEKLYELKDILCDSIEEFDTLKGGELKMGELEALNMLTDTVKNVDKICMLEEEGEYSRDDGMDMDGSYNRGSSYARRGGRRGGRRYSRADGDMGGTGRDGGYSGTGYSMRGRRRDARGRYSRDDGMDVMSEHLDAMMDEATPEQRRAIEKMRHQLENA